MKDNDLMSISGGYPDECISNCIKGDAEIKRLEIPFEKFKKPYKRCSSEAVITKIDDKPYFVKKKIRGYWKTLTEGVNSSTLHDYVSEYDWLVIPEALLVEIHDPVKEELEYGVAFSPVISFKGNELTENKGYEKYELIKNACQDKETGESADKLVEEMLKVFSEKSILHTDLRWDHVFYSEKEKIMVIDTENSRFPAERSEIRKEQYNFLKDLYNFSNDPKKVEKILGKINY